MRTSQLPIVLLALAFVGIAATATFASASGPTNTTHADEANETSDNHTATAPRLNESEREARHAELEQARHSAIDAFKENRTAALAAFHASLNATRASFMENKTAVIDACRAAHNETTANETGGDHCVRDGLKPLIEKAHAEIKAAQQTLREALEAARAHAFADFGHHRDETNRRHGIDGAARPSHAG